MRSATRPIVARFLSVRATSALQYLQTIAFASANWNVMVAPQLGHGA